MFLTFSTPYGGFGPDLCKKLVSRIPNPSEPLNQQKIYEENMRAREGELREQRMKEEADREKLKEEVKSRNRARAEEERQKREEEEAEENEVNASDDEGESGGKKAGEGPEDGTVPEVD